MNVAEVVRKIGLGSFQAFRKGNSVFITEVLGKFWGYQKKAGKSSKKARGQR
jgi:hypothetical protein